MTDFPPGFLPPGTSAGMVFTDKTPNTIIVHRIVVRSFDLVRCTDLTAEEASDFLDLVIVIARKMLSVWNHLQAYHAEEARLIHSSGLKYLSPRPIQLGSRLTGVRPTLSSPLTS